MVEYLPLSHDGYCPFEGKSFIHEFYAFKWRAWDPIRFRIKLAETQLKTQMPPRLAG